MHRVMFTATQLAAVTLAAPPSLSAQLLFADPVYFAPSHGAGISVYTDVGAAYDDLFLGGRAILDLDIAAFQGGFGVLPRSDWGTTFTSGGAASLKVLRGPSHPFDLSVQAGVGWGEHDFEERNAFLGVGVGKRLATRTVSYEPWLAGRWHQHTVNGGSDGRDRRSFGVSGGIYFVLQSGFGIHLALDARVADPLSEHMSGSMGLHWRFALP